MMLRRAHGFALIDLLFVMGIIGVLSAIATPRFVAVRQSAGAASALVTIRAIGSAQVAFAITCGNGFYAPNLSTLGIPPPGSTQPFLQRDLGAGDVIAKSGYTFEVAGSPAPFAPPSCNGLGAGLGSFAYKLRAEPVDPAFPKFYASNANGVIYEDASSLWAVMPESGTPPTGSPVH